MRAPKHPSFLMAASLAPALALAAPLVAQNNPNSFNLPVPSPTPTASPEVEGPADDTGVVPRGPRVIATETPTPTATPSPTSTPAPAVVVPRPIQGPAAGSPADRAVPPSAARTDPAPAADTAQSSGSTGQGPLIDLPTDETVDFNPSADPAPVPPVPIATPTIATELPTESAESSTPLWWWIIGLVALIGVPLIAGIFVTWRRNRPRSIEPPKPYTPVDSGPDTPPRIDLLLDITGATRSMMMFSVDFRLVIANRSPKAVRDVQVAAVLTSAQRGAAGPGNAIEFDRPDPVNIARIGPNQSETIR
ncbi:MAG: hypothetical protein AAGK02_10815, partial [Pseudomonadota bacterium]